MLLARLMSALVTFGTDAISSRGIPPIIFPNCRRDSMIRGSHSSQFSPYSRQSAMNSLIELRTEMDGGPVPALSKYARREVTGICFLTRSMFKETPRLDEAQLARLSINGMLGGVEVLDACYGNAVLAPELVSLGAVLGVAVGYNVSAVSAANDEDFPHLVMWK